MQLKLSYTPAATAVSGLAAAVAYSGGGYALSATTMADGLAHIITISGIAATDHSGKTFTITGTDADGITQSEGIAGPNGAVTVSSTYHYLTVTSITVSATTGADTFNLGWTAIAVSPTIMLNRKQVDFLVSLGLLITGTISVTLQHCLDNLREALTPEQATWWPHSTLVTKTASADGNYAFPVSACRLLVNSVTATATMALFVQQDNNAL